MKKLFPGYYRPSDEVFAEMWQKAIFAFDANMLLNIYRYTPQTRDSFFEVLEKLRERVWLPYQAAQEFQARRLGVISDQEEAYVAVESLFDKAQSLIEAGLNAYRRKHTFLDVERLSKSLNREFEKARKGLEKVREQHPSYVESDPLRDRITALFEGKVGDSYDEKRLAELYTEAEKRFASKIPPGYNDTKKDKPQRYGDAIIWFQLIDHAKQKQVPLFLITDDSKDDWWLIHKGKTIGPRPELIQEMHSKTAIPFYMYSSDRFLEYAQKLLMIEDQEGAIAEAKEIREQDTANRIAASDWDYYGEAVYGEGSPNWGRMIHHTIEKNDARAAEMARRLADYPEYDTAMRKFVELQSNPSYQAMMRELDWLESNPGAKAAREMASNSAIDSAIQRAHELESNPAYRAALELESNPATREAMREAQKLASDPAYRRLAEQIAKSRF
jgi:hypothetical protein